jgi:hypothetical protein
MALMVGLPESPAHGRESKSKLIEWTTKEMARKCYLLFCLMGGRMRDLSDINERLNREFDGRIRIRWSNQHQNYSVEQKYARAATKWSEREDDEVIRAREGYLQIFAVTPGDRFECERCRDVIKVPINEFRLIKCANCTRRGVDSRYILGFFDLDSEHIIDHLRRLDPLKGTQQKIRTQIAEANQKRQQELERDQWNFRESYVKDGMEAKLFGIPQTAINKVAMWEDAPKSIITNEKQKIQQT